MSVRNKLVPRWKKKVIFFWGPRSYSDAMSLTQRLLTSNCAWMCVHVRHSDMHTDTHTGVHMYTYVYTYIHTYKYMDTHTNIHKWRHTHISTYSSQSCQGEAAWLWSHKTSQKAWKTKWQLKKHPWGGSRKRLLEMQFDAQFFRCEVGEDEKTFVKSVQRKSVQQSGLAGSHTEQTQPDSRWLKMS